MKSLLEIASQTIGMDEIKIDHNTTVKFGIDATSDSLHLGHLIPLLAFKKFLEEGCHGVLIIGDFTARIGDPSGRDKARPVLTKETTTANANKIKQQVEKILGNLPFQCLMNSFMTPSCEELLPLLNEVTVNSMLGRDHFASRKDSISLLELMCPILQAWDSIKLQPDIEIGGNDQLANCILARDLMGKFCERKQAIMLFPILLGTDGSQKMSKTLGNQIFLNDSPRDVFGKTMSIPDSLLDQWFTLLLHKSPSPDLSPMKNKECLAFCITEMLHNTKDALEAATWFDLTFRKSVFVPDRKVPIQSSVAIVDLLVSLGWASSRSDARRLLAGKGVKFQGSIVDESFIVNESGVLTKGKRNAIEISFEE